MRVVIFFTFLFLLLLKGNDVSYAAIHPNSIGYSSAQHIKKTQQEKEYSSSIDIENEDEDEGSNGEFIKKYRSLAATCLTLYCPFFSGYIQSNFSISGPLNERLWYKYITHRTLRI